MVKIGDIVEIFVTKVSGYACWGVYEGKVGFSHVVDWSREKPVPERRYPREGELFRVKVFHLTEGRYKELAADVSHDGMFNVDFAGSAALLEEVVKEQELL